ncbi:MAG TPA: hypothetical protein VIU34_16180 [Steroidobacter sp.]
MTSDVIVTQWNSKPTEKNPDAHLHDCLWEMAMEQAALKRMKDSGDDFGTAMKKVTPKEHMQQLDIICQDNGFRKFGSGGSGRDPNLVFDGEKIKVRIDPTTLMKTATGVDTKPVTNAYTKAVTNDSGTGPDINKKEQLDQWLQTVPGFDKLPEPERISLIEAYARDGVDRAKLNQLANSKDFQGLDEDTRQRLLNLYGSKDKPAGTAEIDKLLATPGEASQKKLRLIGSEGFATLDPNQQKRLLERYEQDKQFGAAIDTIVTQKNFTEKNATAEAHALDVLYRYAGRKGSGYGLRTDKEKTPVLVELYNRVLSKPEFKLEENGGAGKPETADQSAKIEDYVKNIYDITKNY